MKADNVSWEECMRLAPRLALWVFAASLVWGVAQADQVNFKADLSGASEVPPVASPGKGSATASLDTATKTLTWTVAYSGLSGPPTAGHIHGPAAPGANAGVLVPFSGDLASPIKGSAPLTDAQISDLETGKLYVNLHTADNKPGEIRGQLVRAP
jgi:CHRD domain-containing protein